MVIVLKLAQITSNVEFVADSRVNSRQVEWHKNVALIPLLVVQRNPILIWEKSLKYPNGSFPFSF
jgi:hypothetical protein